MPPSAVLFVGNSYTLYHDVPSQVARLAHDAGVAIAAEIIAEGGAHLGLHATATGALERIERGGLAAVVVQDQSTGPLHDRARFEDGATKLARAARMVSAELVWFETWARAAGHEVYRYRWSGRTPVEMGARLHSAYAGVADREGGVLAPVGRAFELALREDPSLALHDDDGHHASIRGAHLAALVLAGAIAGADPVQARWSPAELDGPELNILRCAAERALADRSEGRAALVARRPM